MPEVYSLAGMSARTIENIAGTTPVARTAGEAAAMFAAGVPQAAAAATRAKKTTTKAVTQVITPMEEAAASIIAGEPEGVATAALPLAGVGGALASLLASLGITLPAGVLTALGVAGTGYAAYQALGGGEGGGLFGLNILGGDEYYLDGIPMGGPGLAEPPAAYVQKEWHVSYDWGRLQYYLVKMPGQRRKIACYNTATKQWSVWNFPTPRLAVIGKNMPSHKMITRLRRNLSRQRSDARTILKLVSPGSLRTPRRYYRRRR